MTEVSANTLTVVFVKKLLDGGEACAKCRDVEARLRADGLMPRVDEIVVARDDDPASPGMVLARRHGVTRAPFFVVRQPDGGERVFQSYLAFRRWLATSDTTNDATTGELSDIVDRHPDLAFI